MMSAVREGKGIPKQDLGRKVAWILWIDQLHDYERRDNFVDVIYEHVVSGLTWASGHPRCPMHLPGHLPHASEVGLSLLYAFSTTVT